VDHLLDRRAFEQPGQQVVALIVAMKVEVHVLVDSGQFVCHRSIQQSDALLVHGGLLLR
jgi:hypothetical protein